MVGLKEQILLHKYSFFLNSYHYGGLQIVPGSQSLYLPSGICFPSRISSPCYVLSTGRTDMYCGHMSYDIRFHCKDKILGVASCWFWRGKRVWEMLSKLKGSVLPEGRYALMLMVQVVGYATIVRINKEQHL